MKQELEKFNNYANSLLESYLSRTKKSSDSNDIIENTSVLAHNSSLATEFVSKELDNLNKYASDLIDNYNGDKIELENELKSVANNIIQEYPIKIASH